MPATNVSKMKTFSQTTIISRSFIYTQNFYNVTDSFAMQSGDLIGTNISFYLIASSGSIFPFEGVLGLSPSVYFANFSFFTPEPLPLVMSQLGLIQAGQVGLNLFTDNSKQSSMTIGGYDTKEFRDKTETLDSVAWLNNTPNNQIYNSTGFYLGWSSNLTKVYYGGASFDDG